MACVPVDIENSSNHELIVSVTGTSPFGGSMVLYNGVLAVETSKGGAVYRSIGCWVLKKSQYNGTHQEFTEE